MRFEFSLSFALFIHTYIDKIIDQLQFDSISLMMHGKEIFFQHFYFLIENKNTYFYAHTYYFHVLFPEVIFKKKWRFCAILLFTRVQISKQSKGASCKERSMHYRSWINEYDILEREIEHECSISNMWWRKHKWNEKYSESLKKLKNEEFLLKKVSIPKWIII